jgi:hypothetical protein
MPFNVTGHPAITVRTGLSKNGLPLSGQFVGPLFLDSQVLGVAAAYERSTGPRNGLRCVECVGKRGPTRSTPTTNIALLHLAR